MHKIEDYIFEFIYDMALKDATIQKAYQGKLEVLKCNSDIKK